MRHVTLILILCGISGCASLTNRERLAAYDGIEKCDEPQTAVYFLATKDDLVFTLAPLAVLAGIKCEKYTVGTCDRIATAWVFFAPFTAVDIPFALARDIYEFPNDIKYSRKLRACKSKDAHNNSLKSDVFGYAKSAA